MKQNQAVSSKWLTNEQNRWINDEMNESCRRLYYNVEKKSF